MKNAKPVVARKQPVIKGTTVIRPPWEPCDNTLNEHLAIHALVTGKATADQQLLFMEWFKRATGIGEMEFRPDDERASNFASGKRFVALHFFNLVRTHPPQPK